jgi:hypothetical protein
MYSERILLRRPPHTFQAKKGTKSKPTAAPADLPEADNVSSQQVKMIRTLTERWQCNTHGRFCIIDPGPPPSHKSLKMSDVHLWATMVVRSPLIKVPTSDVVRQLKGEATVEVTPPQFLDNPPDPPAPPAEPPTEPADADNTCKTTKADAPSKEQPPANQDAAKLAQQLLSLSGLQMPTGLPMGVSPMMPPTYPMPFSMPNYLFPHWMMPSFNPTQFMGAGPTANCGAPLHSPNYGAQFPSPNYGGQTPPHVWGAPQAGQTLPHAWGAPPAPAYGAPPMNYVPRQAHNMAPVSSTRLASHEPPISQGTRCRSNQEPPGSSDIEMDSPPQYPNILEWLQQLTLDAGRNLDGVDYTQHVEVFRQNGIDSLADMALISVEQLRTLGFSLGLANRLLKWSVDYREKLVRKKKRAKLY